MVKRINNLFRFHEMSECLVQSARDVADEKLACDLEDFLIPYSGGEQRVPRSDRELFQAQVLRRQLLIATRNYGLVYEWYPLFKNPFGANLAKVIPTHVHHIRSAARGYRWISGYDSVLECGCGPEALGLELARYNKRWIASDIVLPRGLTELIEVFSPGQTFEFTPMDAITLSQVEDGSVEVVFSRSLFEHLLRDDAMTHLNSAYRVLKPGGKLVIACPARVGPPSDITNRFPGYSVAAGLHIREYRVDELAKMLDEMGFGWFRSRFVRSRLVGAFPVCIQRLNALPVALSARLESVAHGSWSFLEKTAFGRKLWKGLWGHIGATSIIMIASKPGADRAIQNLRNPQ